MNASISGQVSQKMPIINKIVAKEYIQADGNPWRHFGGIDESIRAVSERIESVGGFPNRLISRTPSKSLLQAQSLSAQNRRTDRRGPHARPRNLRRNLQALAMYKLLQILWL